MGQYFFRNPGPDAKGLLWIATPENTELEHLRYGRLRLSRGEEFELGAGEHEWVLLALSGECDAEVSPLSCRLRKHCALYVPKRAKVSLSAVSDVDLAVFSAPAEAAHEPHFADVDRVLGRADKHRLVGGETAKREVITLIGEDVAADRLLVGVTWTMKGNWSSWPPHEHGDMLEEVYVFYDMHERAFGVQLVYDDFDNVMFVGIVRSGDAVVIPRGYHPNVAAPGFELKYVWAMCARRPRVDRVYGRVRVQEGYE